MVEIYSIPLRYRYVSSRFSIAWLSKLCYYIILIIVPFYIAYESDNFYDKFKTYREQPQISFDNEVIIVGKSFSPSSLTTNIPILWSSFPTWNSIVSSSSTPLSPPQSLRSSFTDNNADGINDQFSAIFTFPLSSYQSIQSIDILLFFHVFLSDKVSLSMSALLPLSLSSPLPSSSLSLTGDIYFHQISPLGYQTTRSVYDVDIVNNTLFNSISDCDLKTIIVNNHMGRNESLVVENVKSLWNSIPLSGVGVPSFQLEMTFRIPQSVISYTPGPAETIKFAFIQWLAAFWFLYFFISWIWDFIFRNKLIQTNVWQDGKSLVKQHQF